MAIKQINLKVDSQLFDHICKKSQRNSMSNQEYIRELIQSDFKKPSEGDKEMLMRYGRWVAKMTSGKLQDEIQSAIAIGLKSPLDKYSKSVRDFINTIESSNKKMLTENSSLTNDIGSLSKLVISKQSSVLKEQKKQFITIYSLLGGNLVIQGVLFLRWLFL